MSSSPTFVRSVARIAIVGLCAAAAVSGGGVLLERSRLGDSDDAAVRKIEDELGRRFAQTADALTARAQRVRAGADTIGRAGRDSAAVRQLFQSLSAELAPDLAASAGLTIYNDRGNPLAWAGRVSDVPRDRIDGPGALFVSLDPLGPRLVRVEPVPDPLRPSGPRLATIVAEQLVVERTDVSSPVTDTFRLPTSVVDVGVRATPGLAPPQLPYAFAIRSGEGAVLAEAEVSPGDLVAAHARWRAWTRAAAVSAVAITVLLCAGPLLELRRHAQRRGAFPMATAGVVFCLVGGRALLRLAVAPVIAGPLAGPLELVPDALLLTGLVWLALDTMERRRVSRPRARLVVGDGAAVAVALLGHLVAGALAAGILWAYERVLAGIAVQTAQELVSFSLHPLEGARLGTAAGLVLLHAAVIWGAAGVLRLPAVLWRVPRRGTLRMVAVGSAAAGAALVVTVSRLPASTAPLGPLVVAAGAAGLAAALLSRPRAAARRSSQAARLGLFFIALALPALAMYPSLDAFAVASKERLVETQLAPQVASQREDLQVRRLPQALEAIDAMSSLQEFVTSSSEDAAPTTDRAFIVWSQTELASTRTTSAIELYGPNGRLVSRFALDLPEYAVTEYRGGSCTDWELYEEVSPFGSTLRNVLRASRAICVNRQRVGGIVVRARLDYRSLPFASSPNPYLESLMPVAPRNHETAFGGDVEMAFYGWSRAPLYASGTRVWPLADDVFDRMIASREATWEGVIRDDEAFRVYFFNDRGGIYALGYPVVTWFGHLINLGELVFFCGALYVLLILGATLFNAVTSQTPASGRALLREVRSSFYRKLFIAFVASAVVPVVVLALATSTYFANQFRAGVEEAAVKTATVAQRLIEDYVALQQRGAGSLDRIDDEFMLLVRRAIDQDVNLFDGPRLRATSERPLFASRLLPGRTPADVYRAIALDRLPTTVMVEELGGSPGYLVAAAPVRAGAREGIVTVPQTLRQREIEQQIDEIDRRVLSAAVLFVLLGSALGYWMAERIADPVNRLTRATRRIARGDLDARIAATSSDELRRLVEDFNRMADDLKTQRANLERTQRLEAWADMARQVAHDIKNPLTPIQLSAEHAQRVNLDRGRPLSPVLDECVSSILSQVKLLRQISSEFSSFASAPTPRPEATDVGALLDEVVEPYRTGLANRIALVVDTPPDLPLAFIDRTLFARALTNVMENALHAMPGTGTLTIRAGAEAPPGTAGPGEPPAITIEVVDTGMGMDPEALARIFEPYFSTKATGTGLGLTIARRNVELLGGAIRVTSARGRGTTVIMTLPRVTP
ncbi:MAG TPA: HAMP domain-containing sensor histidine kinase [Vicinamibacterales bacterium]|nr:HAMP domain-containing sensor histidine kinase [Vicinamibacterales bacterium]